MRPPSSPPPPPLPPAPTPHNPFLSTKQATALIIVSSFMCLTCAGVAVAFVFVEWRRRQQYAALLNERSYLLGDSAKSFPFSGVAVDSDAEVRKHLQGSVALDVPIAGLDENLFIPYADVKLGMQVGSGTFATVYKV